MLESFLITRITLNPHYFKEIKNLLLLIKNPSCNNSLQRFNYIESKIMSKVELTGYLYDINYVVQLTY